MFKTATLLASTLSVVAMFGSGAFADDSGAYYRQGDWAVVQLPRSSPVFCLARYDVGQGNAIALYANENEGFSIMIGRQNQNYTDTRDHQIRLYFDGALVSDYTVDTPRPNILAIEPIGVEETDSLQPLLVNSKIMKVRSDTHDLDFEIDLTSIDTVLPILWGCTDGEPFSPAKYAMHDRNGNTNLHENAQHPAKQDSTRKTEFEDSLWRLFGNRNIFVVLPSGKISGKPIDLGTRRVFDDLIGPPGRVRLEC